MDKEKKRKREGLLVLVEGYKHILQHNPGSKSNHSAREHTRVVCVFGGGVHGARPLLFPPHPSCKGPHLCNPAYPPLHSHRSRHGRLRRPPEEPLPPPHAHGPPRLVKWGGLVLKRDRSGKDDTHSTERQHKEGNKECWSKDKDTYYIIALRARVQFRRCLY